LFPNLSEIIRESYTGVNIFDYLDNIQDDILNNLSLAPSYRKRQRIILDHFREFLKNEHIKFFPQLSLSTAAKYRNWRLSMYSEKTKGNIAPKTVKEELMLLKNKVFERAVDERLIQENPFRNATKELRVYKKEIMPFTIDEVQQLIRHAPNDLHRDFYTVLYYTGSRFGEVANLEWTDIDFDNNVLHIRNKAKYQTKTRKSRVIPLHTDLAKVLRKRHETSNSRYVFPSPIDPSRPIKNLLRKFKAVRDELNIDSGKTLHSFRHAFASHLQAKGVPLEVIQELLGHSDIRMTRHYQKIEPEVLKKAVEKLVIE
jgi:integrase